MYTNHYSSIDDGKGIWLKSNFHTHAGTAGMSFWMGEDTCGIYAVYKRCNMEGGILCFHRTYPEHIHT